MAYYPRNYIPDFPPLSRQSDYPPPRPDFPLPYEPYYPRRRQAYPPYEPDYPADRGSQGYPTLPTTMHAEARRTLGPDVRTGDEYYPVEYVVNKRYKYYGIVLCFLAVASFAVEIANVIFTIFNFKTQYMNGPLAVPYILTWIAAGIWGSIPVFITGILAIKVAGTYKNQVRVFALFCSLSAVVFAPAMIALSIAEIIMYQRSSSSRTTYNSSDCYSFDVVSTLICPKFVLPLVVAIVGGIEFYLTLMVTVVFWCCKPGKEVKKTTKAIPSSFDYDRDAPYSPYDPEIVRRRQAPYYRGLPPNGLQPQEDSMAADPEMQVVRLPQRVDVAPDFSFLRSYHDSRPFMSRGFGFAPAYNHGLSYGNLPGLAPPSSVYPFNGSMPSLAAFGTPGPNPAYRIVYN